MNCVRTYLLDCPRLLSTPSEHSKSIRSLLSAGPQDADHWVVPDLGKPINQLEDLLELASHLPAPSSA